MIPNGQSQVLHSTSLCQIIREHKFEAKIRQIAEVASRALEIDEAIDWALQRNPKGFRELRDGYYIWVTQKSPLNGIPGLRILYHYDESTNIVKLIDVDEV